MTTLHPHLARWYQYCPHCRADLQARDKKTMICSRCGFIFYLNPAPAVTAVVVKDDRVLMTKRGIEPQKGQWDLPGGFIDPGESGEAAAIREIEEETGLTIEIIAPLGTIGDTYEGEPTLNLLYLARVVSGTAQPHDDVAEIYWLSLDELPPDQEFAFQNVAVALRNYKQYLEKK